jgi:hypothetical protein
MDEKMNGLAEATQPATKPRKQTVDALLTWEEAGVAATPALSLVRLDANEHLLIPFTTQVQRVETHYLDYIGLRGYVRCCGADCLLCRIGRQRDTRDLLPVYDPLSRAVVVLPISPNIRPGALRPQVTPVLQRCKANERVLIAVRKENVGTFRVSTCPLPEGVDDGADAILTFMEQFDTGAIDLASVYQQVLNEDLANIAEISCLLQLKGIKL